MLKISDVKISACDKSDISTIAAKALGVDKSQVLSCKILRKSIDARKNVCYVYTLAAKVKNEKAIKKGLLFMKKNDIIKVWI